MATMKAIRKSDVDTIESWEELAQLEADLRAMVAYVEARKHLARATAYSHPVADLVRAVADAALTAPAAVSW